MLLTPHIVRTHELTAEDLAPIYIGTQQNLGLGGPPPLIAPQPADDAGRRRSATGAHQVIPTTPGVTPGGVPRSPVCVGAGCAAGESSDAAGDVAGADADRAGAARTGHAGCGHPPRRRRRRRRRRAPAARRAADRRGHAGRRPGTGRLPRDPSATRRRRRRRRRPARRSDAGAGHRHARRARVPVAGGPYTVPLSINNASRLSVMTLTVTFNPNVLRVRNVQDGTFMRQGGVATTLHAADRRGGGPRRHRDHAHRRSGRARPAPGLLAALLFDAVGAGQLDRSRSAASRARPKAARSPLQFSPVTVTVR